MAKKPQLPPKRYVWRIEREWLGWYVRIEGLEDGINICWRTAPVQEEQDDGEEERVGGTG